MNHKIHLKKLTKQFSLLTLSEILFKMLIILKPLAHNFFFFFFFNFKMKKKIQNKNKKIEIKNL
jgi:hypothetical protein